MLITTKEFLAEIDRFLAETGMADNEFGRACCNNSKFVPRLREGVRNGTGDVKLNKVHRVLEFMKYSRKLRRESRSARKTAAE